MHVLNGWMLIGLAAIIAPLLIHLFARRQPPVVDWGAWQFLQSAQHTRRTVTLNDAWLLLLRVFVIVIAVMALARPWVSAAWLPLGNEAPPRDVAVILDGSSSTAILHEGRSIQSRLQHDVRQLVQALPRGSTVQLYDARDAVVPLLPSRTASVPNAIAALNELGPPTGTSHLPRAISTAVRALWDGQHAHREIVIFSDGQRWPWQVEETAEWISTAGLLRQSAVDPRVSVILREPNSTLIDDVGWTRANLSRERMIPGQSIMIAGVLRNQGSTVQRRHVWCEINGRPSAEHQREIRLQPDGTTEISFDVTFPQAGRHALSLRSETDAIPGNDRVDFIADVVTGVKVLLVDGTPSDDPLKSEVFFASAALETSDAANWIQASTVAWNEMPLETLHDYGAIVLANVPELSRDQTTKLQHFVTRGGAVLITLGDQAIDFLKSENGMERGWLPIESVAIAETESATHVADDGLALPWLQRFRADHGGELGTAEFRQWWTLKFLQRENQNAPQVWARFANGDPWLLAFRQGWGTVVIATSTLDADGNALPAKPDYVAWLHELLLTISAPPQRRNLAAGDSIPLPIPLRRQQPVIVNPWGQTQPLANGAEQSAVVARWPGVYIFQTEKNRAGAVLDPALLCGSPEVEAFAAQTDGRETDLAPLTDGDRAALAAMFPLQFLDELKEEERQWAAETPRREIAGWLLWCVLAGLMAESFVTYRRSRTSLSAEPHE